VQARQIPGYSRFQALLFRAMEIIYQTLRANPGSEAEKKSAGVVFLRIPSDRTEPPIRRPDAAAVAAREADWLVLPGTATGNYPEGIKMLGGMARFFYSQVRRVLPPRAAEAKPLRFLGLVHAGLYPDGRPYAEASMVAARFELDTPEGRDRVSSSCRQLYEAVVLPRLVLDARHLRRDASGFLIREDGRLVYDDGTPAQRITPEDVASLPPLRFLGFSSGVATVQEMDTIMRGDVVDLGYSATEQRALFCRAVCVSFGSASEIGSEADRLGTPVVDITACNDARSVAGTTTLDYTHFIAADGELRQFRGIQVADDAAYRYSQGGWKMLGTPETGRVVLRRLSVFLRGDAVRAHDGHSIKRYLEGMPDDVCQLLGRLQEAQGAVDFSADLARTARPASHL
jgi:hypothetical protein